MNSIKDKYRYRLRVVLPDRVLVANADMVGNTGFDIQSLAVNFSKEYFDAIPRHFLFHPAINGAFYDVVLTFTFKEQRTPDGDSVPRTMRWPVATYTESELLNNMDGDAVMFFYRPETFYAKLSEFIGGDTAVVGLKRFISDYPVEVIIYAGGDNLRQYVYNNNVDNGFSAGDNEFSLIDGGYGVFSSRMTLRRAVKLGGETVPELVEMSNWGFKFIGGGEE